MSKLFMVHEALPQNNLESFKVGMTNIIGIEKNDDDDFLRHNSIWNIPVIHQLYGNYGPVEQVIIKFITQLNDFDNYISTEDQLSDFFPNFKNAFHGIDFAHTPIKPLLQ